MAPYTGFSDPGSSTNTALDTATYIGGSLDNKSAIFQNSIGPLDQYDLYKFTLSSSSIVSLGLDGLTSTADLRLLNDSGSRIASSIQPGTTSESIRRTLAAGTYYVQIESTLSTATTTNYNLTLGAETIQESFRSDNSYSTAYFLGNLSSSNTSLTVNDFVSSTGVIVDGEDYYKIQLNNNGAVTINLTGLSANADLDLRNSSGFTVLQISNQANNSPETITANLSQGTYYVRVYQATSGFTNYNLQLSLDAEPDDFAGNTRQTARNINTLSSTVASYTDFVNSTDNLDYYRFDLTSNALVNFSLTPTAADANLQLLDSNGNGIQSSNLAGTAVDSISRSLIAGTYYLAVTPGSGAATFYTLTASAQSIAPDQAPNNRSSVTQSLNISNTTFSISEFVGNIDTIDWYRFDLNTSGNFNLLLNGLSDNADVQLWSNAESRVIYSSTQSGTTQESITAQLASGTYFVGVYTANSSIPVNTFYNLSLSVVADPQLPQSFDLNVGAASSNPKNLTAWGNNLYFTANDDTTGTQLWRSDGTLANTNRVTSINSGNFNPDNLIVFNNKLYFTANDGTSGRELWVYDGSQAQLVTDINPNAASSNPSNLIVAGNKLFFTADNGQNGRELWVYDGTNASLVRDIAPGGLSSNTSNLTAFAGQLFFTVNGNQLWSSDGTLNGTQQQTIPGNFSSSIKNLTIVSNNLYFATDQNLKLWKYTSGTVSLVKDFTTLPVSSPLFAPFIPDYFTSAGNTLYFALDSDGDGYSELWKSDGTTNGTVQVKDDNNKIYSLTVTFQPSFAASAAVGNVLYFGAADLVAGWELWKSDGTSGGTDIVADIAPGAEPNNSIPQSLVVFNGSLYFVASSGNSRQVWSSDGTAGGTRKVTSIANNGNASPAQLTAVGTRLFFTANNGTNGTELWVL